jgi:hypothetical protein
VGQEGKAKKVAMMNICIRRQGGQLAIALARQREWSTFWEEVTDTQTHHTKLPDEQVADTGKI